MHFLASFLFTLSFLFSFFFLKPPVKGKSGERGKGRGEEKKRRGCRNSGAVPQSSKPNTPIVQKKKEVRHDSVPLQLQKSKGKAGEDRNSDAVEGNMKKGVKLQRWAVYQTSQTL